MRRGSRGSDGLFRCGGCNQGRGIRDPAGLCDDLRAVTGLAQSKLNFRSVLLQNAGEEPVANDDELRPGSLRGVGGDPTPLAQANETEAPEPGIGEPPGFGRRDGEVGGQAWNVLDISAAGSAGAALVVDEDRQAAPTI